MPPAVSPLRQLAPTRARRVDLRGSQGRAIAAVETRMASDAPTVLLLPGFTGTKEDFAPLLDPIADAGFTAVAVDLPGQFESPGPADERDYVPDALAPDVVLLAGALRSQAPDAPLHLLGHSFGGLVARAAVIAAPAAFDSLVLLDSGPGKVGPSRQPLLEALAPVLAAHGIEAVYEASLALARQDPRFVPPPADLAAFLRRRFLASSPVGLQGMGDALLHEPDRVADLAAVLTRGLVVGGVDDDVWSEAVQRRMATDLGVPFVPIPAAAHSPAVENPAALLPVLLEFWRPSAS